MQVKRFLAADMRRALEMVRQELGPDAIILSSTRTKEGVEILTTKQTPPPLQAETVQPEITPPDIAQPELPETDSASAIPVQQRVEAIEQARQRQLTSRAVEESADEFLRANQRVNAGIPRRAATERSMASMEIGRASCRERGEIAGGAGSVKKKTMDTAETSG